MSRLDKIEKGMAPQPVRLPGIKGVAFKEVRLKLADIAYLLRIARAAKRLDQLHGATAFKIARDRAWLALRAALEEGP